MYAYILSRGGKITGKPYTRYFKYSPEEVIIEIGFPTDGSTAGLNEIYKSSLPETMAGRFYPYWPIQRSWPSLCKKLRNG